MLAPLYDLTHQFLNQNGSLAAGGHLFVTVNKEEASAVTYADADGLAVNPANISIDSNGRASVWVDLDKAYTLYVYGSNGALLYTVWPQQPINSAEGAVGPVGPAGADGKDGKDGVDGKDGADGKDGVDGKDGADGKDGVDGKDGKDGKDGADGKDGTIVSKYYVGYNSALPVQALAADTVQTITAPSLYKSTVGIYTAADNSFTLTQGLWQVALSAAAYVSSATEYMEQCEFALRDSADNVVAQFGLCRLYVDGTQPQIHAPKDVTRMIYIDATTVVHFTATATTAMYLQLSNMSFVYMGA